MLEILQPLYESLGLENQPGDDLHTQLLREEVVRWACRLDHEACIRNSIRLFQQWIEDPDNFRSAFSVIISDTIVGKHLLYVYITVYLLMVLQTDLIKTWVFLSLSTVTIPFSHEE